MRYQTFILILSVSALSLGACKKAEDTTAPSGIATDAPSTPPADSSMSGAPTAGDAVATAPTGPQPSANPAGAGAPGATGTATSQSTGSVPGSTAPSR
ncbi:MAG: hypothetical protein JWM33_609 [Caulobacteraceae bacterium]|nr:hypothetical protein [Caulobacteraceae bacterium]